MDEVLSPLPMSDSDAKRISATIAAQTPRLREFVRRRVDNLADVDDIVQETLYELVAAYRLPAPIEQVAGWLARVARNRIIDRFRARARRPPHVSTDATAADGGADPARYLERWLASEDSGPEALHTRSMLATALEEAIAELPAAQREAFVAHEIEGRNFRDMAAQTGVPVNTLLSRKHAAVLQLRRRLASLYDELES